MDALSRIAARLTPRQLERLAHRLDEAVLFSSAEELWLVVRLRCWRQEVREVRVRTERPEERIAGT